MNSVTDEWDEVIGRFYVRVDITGERHKMLAVHEKDQRLCKTKCNLVVAWVLGEGTKAEKRDCKNCFSTRTN